MHSGSLLPRLVLICHLLPAARNKISVKHEVISTNLFALIRQIRRCSNRSALGFFGTLGNVMSVESGATFDDLFACGCFDFCLAGLTTATRCEHLLFNIDQQLTGVPLFLRIISGQLQLLRPMRRSTTPPRSPSLDETPMRALPPPPRRRPGIFVPTGEDGNQSHAASRAGTSWFTRNKSNPLLSVLVIILRLGGIS